MKLGYSYNKVEIRDINVTRRVVTKSGSPSPSPSWEKAELRTEIACHFFNCAWIFTKFGGIYSGVNRNMMQTLNFTKLARY